MNTGVIMRNSKVRTFLYVLLGCCMLFTVFLLSSTHTKLKDSQESNDKCQQQRDSLSAQLQVVYEHKSRLEKTLQVEIADRKRAEDGVKLVRDQSERDRADSRDKIKALQKQLSDSQLAQAEEFKNLKTSYDALHQEKEKVYAELASHVALLQHERDAKLKLARQLEELQQSRKADTQMEAMLQKQLETCRVETAQLYMKFQQQNAVVPQQKIASAGNEKPGAGADLLEGDRVKLQPAPSFVAAAQTELKTNAKEDRGAGKMGSRYQGAGAESRQPKQAGGFEASNNSAGVAAVGARHPVAAEQALEPPGYVAPQQVGKPTSPHPNDSAADQLIQVPRAAPSLKQNAADIRANKEQPLPAFPQQGGANLGAGSNHLVPSQPGSGAKRALQPAAQPAESSSGKLASAQPAAVKSVKQVRQPARPMAAAEAQAAGPEAAMQAPQAVLPGQAQLEGGSFQQPATNAGPGQRIVGAERQATAAAAAQPLQEQLQQPGVKPVEQPPVPPQIAALNQIPPVLPAPNLAAGKLEPSAAGIEDLASLKEGPAGAGVPVRAKAAAGSQAANKKEVDLAAALQEENELNGVANINKAVAKEGGAGGGVNYGKDLLIGGGRAAGNGQQQQARPKLGRPNQMHRAEPENEDDLEYANAAKDDDAAEDQDDDGPFGPGGGRGKAMPDAADFDDQGADVDQQQQQQQLNNLPEVGVAVNPK